MAGASTPLLVETKGFAFVPGSPYNASMRTHSRFNPAPGLTDFWTQIRRPQPYRWPILGLSILPAAMVLYWAIGSTVYGEPERPKVTYITTLDPTRTDAEIMAENSANQEVKDLRAAQVERIATRKRELYKALGTAAGMDVETIERKAKAERAAKEAAEAKRRADVLERAGKPASAATKNAGENAGESAGQ